MRTYNGPKQRNLLSLFVKVDQPPAVSNTCPLLKKLLFDQRTVIREEEINASSIQKHLRNKPGLGYDVDPELWTMIGIAGGEW